MKPGVNGESFRLQRLLDIARLRTRSRLAELALWQSRAEAARAEAGVLERSRADAERALVAAGEGGVAAGELLARWRQLEELRRRERSALGRAAGIEREVGLRLQAAMASRRDQEAFERLRLRHLERLARALQRAEQLAIDDAATSRHGRAGPVAGE